MTTGPVPFLPPQAVKLIRLYNSSTFEGERAVARRKAEAMLSPEVGGFDRALRIQAYRDALAAAPGNIFAGWSEREEIDEPGTIARNRSAAAERLREWHERRAALVQRFGSLEAVLEPDEREMALRKALKAWRVPGKRPHQRWTWELRGWDYCTVLSKMPADMRAAIEGALPMPTTFAEAQAELEAWRARDAEMQDALGTNGDYLGDYGLDRVCIARMEVIRDLVRHDMRLHTLPEIMARFRLYRERDSYDEPDLEGALFRDLEAYAAREVAA